MAKLFSPLLINGFLFQIVWFCCVLGQNLLAVPAVCLFVIIHFKYFAKVNEWQLLIIVPSLGMALDYVLQSVGVFTTYAEPLPLWLLALWIAFSLTLCHSLQLLAKNYVIASVAGAIGGAMSYIGACKLGVADLLLRTEQAALIFAVEWAILMPLLLVVSNKLIRRQSLW